MSVEKVLENFKKSFGEFQKKFWRISKEVLENFNDFQVL